MISFFVTAVLSFISTEIDNILVMTVLFAQDNGKIKKSQVIAGQYLSLAILTIVSIIGAYGLNFMPQEYIGLLGFIPIALGIKEYISYKLENTKDKRLEEAKKSKTGVLSVTLVALASGADNIGIYIPIFAGFSVDQLVIVIGIFTVMMALWCLLAELITRIPVIRNPLKKYSSIIVPVVFISLGVYIFIINLF